MAVTSRGRIICWKEEAAQIKPDQDHGCIVRCILCLFKMCFPEICRPPTIYEFEIRTKVYAAKNIKQITQQYSSVANCCCCCLEYDCSVQLSFGTFNFSDSRLGFMSTKPAANFFSAVSAHFNIVAGAVEGAVGISSSNVKLLEIVSNTYDRFHNGDVHAVCEKLSKLHSEVIKCLPVLPDVFVQGTNVNSGACQIVDKLSDVTIVDDSGSIKIPSHWMPMLTGEAIISTYGEVYKMTCMQWFFSIITFGYYYCTEIRHMKFARSACILTNKRLVVIDIFHPSGKVPTNLEDVIIQSRSMLPRHIWGGFVQSIGFSLKSSIWTDAGEVSLHFPRGAVSERSAATPFANAMQLTVTRRDASKQFKLPENYVKPTLDKTDLDIMSLLANETPISNFKGSYVWSPFGKNPFCLNWLRKEFCNLPPLANACSDESPLCFPWLVHILTCALRPFKIVSEVVITPNAFVSLIRERNYGFCGFGETVRSDCCISLTDYTVTWISSEKFMGYDVIINGAGHENCCSRIFRDCCIGRICCPIGKSRFSLNFDLDQVFFLLSREGINKNWLADEGLLEQLKCLDMVEVLQSSDV